MRYWKSAAFECKLQIVIAIVAIQAEGYLSSDAWVVGIMALIMMAAIGTAVWRDHQSRQDRKQAVRPLSTAGNDQVDVVHPEAVHRAGA